MSTKRPGNSGGTPPNPGKSGKDSSSGRSGGKEPAGRTVPARADISEIARAVSTSFLILVFGALIQPLVGSILPPSIGQFWLIVVALFAFALAGVRCGRSGPYPPLYGAGGAFGAFVLVVPLQFVQGTFDPLFALYTLIAALVVGAAAGQIGARLRTAS